MSLQPWNLVFLFYFMVYLALRGYYIEQTKKTATRISRVDAVERIVLTLVFVGNLLLPLMYVITSLLSFADYHTSLVFKSAGVAALTGANGLFWKAHKDLGLNWSRSLEIREGHSLVTNGLYAKIRHPMYTAILLFGLGQGLILDNWLGGWSGLATFIVMIVIRLPKEEQMMIEFFGDDYRKYMQTTGSFLPRLRP